MFRRLSAALVALALSITIVAAQTAPISGLPAATAPTGTELVPLVQGGVTKQSAISALISGLPAFTSSAKGVVPPGGSSTTYLRGDGAWATPAGGGGGGVALHPGYRSGEYYRVTPSAGTSNFQVQSGRIYAVPFQVGSASGTVASSLGLQVGTAGAAGSTALVGVYSNSSGRPGTLLGSVTVATDAAGAVITTALGSALNLAAGPYWAVTLFSGTPTVQASGFGDNYLAGFVGGGTAAGSASAASAGLYYDSAYSSGLPGTFPTSGYTMSGGSQVPIPYFRPQ
jgi:hypothetical protein